MPGLYSWVVTAVGATAGNGVIALHVWWGHTCYIWTNFTLIGRRKVFLFWFRLLFFLGVDVLYFISVLLTLVYVFLSAASSLFSSFCVPFRVVFAKKCAMLTSATRIIAAVVSDPTDE